MSRTKRFIDILHGERNAQPEGEAKAEVIARTIGLVHIRLTRGDIEEAFRKRALAAPH